MSSGSYQLEPISEVKEKIKRLKDIYGLREPNRGNIDDPNIVWREEKPDFTRSNYAYLNGKTQNHAEGSLEEVVENLVKRWEMEASHFLKYDQWSTVDTDWKIEINGQYKYDGKKTYEIGNYNVLLNHCPAYQKYGSLNFEESFKLFRTALPEGFAWEVLKVFSGPPVVLFTWRHWGNAIGNYRFSEEQRTGVVESGSAPRQVEMFGLVRVTVKQVDGNLKIQKLEVFYDADTFLGVMEGKIKPEKAINGIIGNVKSTAAQKISNERTKYI